MILNFNVSDLKTKLIDTNYIGINMETYNLKDQYGNPTEFALTVAMEGIKKELIRIQDEIENGEVVGDKKKYIQALFNLNNKLVEKYNSKGGDATGYYLEWEDNKPDSVAIAGLI